MAPSAPEFRLTNEQILSMLVDQRKDNDKGGTTLTADRDIQYHDLSTILIPKGMTMEQLGTAAKAKAAELNKIHVFQRVFSYRPDDGAHATAIVLKRMFGMTVGTDTVKQTMFGEDRQPPSFRTIPISHNRTMEVPWGSLQIPALPKATVELGIGRDRSGYVFTISVSAPKLHAEKIEAFFDAVSDELRLNSIYRGKALRGGTDGELAFFDPHAFNRDKIVFSKEVNRHIAAGIFGLLRHPEAAAAANLSTKRAVLAYGPFGTGKTSLGMITAQEASDNGWTFIKVEARDGEALREAFRTAALYEPCVLFIEDIDRYTPKSTDKDAMAELLDLFDGIGSKTSKLMVVMTTNHIERIPPGMLRPGRIDYVIEIAGLDREGTERLIRAVVPPDLLERDVNFDQVYAEMVGWQPAWIAATGARATELAIARHGGGLVFKLDTIDLIDSAVSHRKQLDLMHKALEGEPVIELHQALGDFVENATRKAVNDTKILDRDGDPMWTLQRESA